MGLSKAEVNLRRLLAAAPNQHNHSKLIHYVTTSRELLEQIGAEAAAGGISNISKAKLNEYLEKIEVLAARLSVSERNVTYLRGIVENSVMFGGMGICGIIMEHNTALNLNMLHVWLF